MKYLLRTRHLLSIFMLYLVCISGANAETLVSITKGKFIVPPIAPHTDSIGNGGLFISGYGRGGSIGEGTEENTVWFHSFNLNRVQWKAFKTADPQTIYSATLVLKYTPFRASHNDIIQIAGLKGIRISEFNGYNNTYFPLGSRERRVISVNLLDYYTSEEILSVLKIPV